MKRPCADPGIFVRGVQVSLAKKALTTFFCDFPGGGGADPLSQPLDPHLTSATLTRFATDCMALLLGVNCAFNAPIRHFLTTMSVLHDEVTN